VPDNEPQNEVIFLEAATTDDAFRFALASKDRPYLSSALDKLGILVDDKEAVLDEIMKIDWRELSVLEERLGRQMFHN
jgi:hypothetical protein